MFRFPPPQQESMEKSVAPIGVYQFIDKHVVTLLLSQGFLDLFGFSEHKEAYHVMDTNMYRDTHPDDVSRIANEAVKFATGENPTYNVVYRSKLDGEYHIIHAQGKHVSMPTGDRIAFIWYFDEGLYSDISGHQEDLNLIYTKMLKESSESNTNFDYLTGLPTMSYFVELSEAWNRKVRKRGHKPVFLFLDLCGFKEFCRRYGFGEGDILIKSLAQLLAGTFNDENCCRYGHDQFIVCTDDLYLDDRINDVLERCTHLNNGRNTLIRVGIYIHDDKSIPIRNACDRAKVACDSLRGKLVNSFTYFDDTMLKRIEMYQYILDNFDRALSEKWIKVHYQPIVRASSNRVCDEEALSRWEDPEGRGTLMPDEFIPILEKNNLLWKLDIYVVEQVIEKLRTHRENDLYTVPVSVNLSRSDFDACDIVEEVRRRVDESGIGRDRITIEMTESTVGKDFAFMKKQVERFQALGFKVWMDDFGRGYSSMDLLQEIHFDLIKLDMYFMRHFDKEKSRIIVIELIKMAIALGIETVVEGVETAEQAEFLKEAGCTKMQGFYYCKPIPTEQMLERYRTGTQIGFENPDESGYYAAISNTNLYDLSGLNKEALEGNQYFSSFPMAIIETDGQNFTIKRYNRPYEELHRKLGIGFNRDAVIHYPAKDSPYGPAFSMAVKKCMKEPGRQITSERIGDGLIIDYLIEHVAVNPVTGMSALIVVVLYITDLSEVSIDNEEMIPADSFVYALSADYTFLYYVDLDTEHFVEYRPDEKSGELRIIRHDVDFFAKCRQDSLRLIHKDDREKLLSEFTKEIVSETIDRKKAFTITYRLITENGPTYVSLKASRLGTSGSRIIIGVNNVDAQMKAQEAFERVKEERTTYARITALAGNYISIYTVDPETDEYVEYSVTEAYEALKLPKKGSSFFEESLQNIEVIHPDDRERIASLLTKEKVLSSIEQNGVFGIDYRLMLGGEPKYVTLKAAMVKEADGPRLIVGISDIDAQVKRDLEYEAQLSQAKTRADIDALTGLRNKHAYLDHEEKLNQMIERKADVEFALTVFDVNDLKVVNDREGHQAGDKLLVSAVKMICNAFKHSPVFRVGGDEFVAILRDQDYQDMDEIARNLDEKNRKHEKSGGVVVAFGMAKYSNEQSVSDVFGIADKAMYAYKQQSKLRKQNPTD